MSMQNSVAQAERAADRPHGERARWIERMMLRLLSLSPGMYMVTLIVTDERIQWSVLPLGKPEG